MKITLIKTINGKKIIQELEEIYGSLGGGGWKGSMKEIQII